MQGLLRILVSVFVLVVFSALASAECIYEDIEEYVVEEEGLCLNGTYYASSLNISNFHAGKRAFFEAHNPNKFEVLAFFSFVYQGDYPGTEEYGLRIGANSTEQVYTNCVSENISVSGNCSILPENVTYYVDEPHNLTPCVKNLTRSRSVCNKTCSSDDDCFLVCSRAGYCHTSYDAPCASDSKECGDKCLLPGMKEAGFKYDCEWECVGLAKDGVCRVSEGSECTANDQCMNDDCNFLGVCGEVVCPEGKMNCAGWACLEPGVLEGGSDYKCDWECIHAGVDGKCKRDFRLYIYIGVGIVVLIMALFLLRFIWKK